MIALHIGSLLREIAYLVIRYLFLSSLVLLMRCIFTLLLGNEKLSMVRHKRGHRTMEGNKLNVGNLSCSVNDQQLRQLFSEYGKAGEVRVVEGKDFGFVKTAT